MDKRGKFSEFQGVLRFVLQVLAYSLKEFKIQLMTKRGHHDDHIQLSQLNHLSKMRRQEA